MDSGGQGPRSGQKEDEILACGERKEQEVQTDRQEGRKEREEEKVCARERETSTRALAHMQHKSSQTQR